MEKKVCEKCGKEIEGYTSNHVDHLMQQHNLKHEREERNKESAETALRRNEIKENS